jgi:hypothetical protein
LQANLLGYYLRDHILELPRSQSCVKRDCKNQLYSIEKIKLVQLGDYTDRILRLLIDLTRIKSISIEIYINKFTLYKRKKKTYILLFLNEKKV